VSILTATGALPRTHWEVVALPRPVAGFRGWLLERERGRNGNIREKK